MYAEIGAVETKLLNDRLLYSRLLSPRLLCLAFAAFSCRYHMPLQSRCADALHSNVNSLDCDLVHSGRAWTPGKGVRAHWIAAEHIHGQARMCKEGLDSLEACLGHGGDLDPS